MRELVIIPEEEWNATHEVIHKRSTRQKGVKTTTHGTMLLSGLLFCGYCGKKLTSFQAKSRTVCIDGQQERKFIPKYRCSSFAYPQEKVCKGQSTYSAKKVENAVVGAIKRYMATLNTQDVTTSYIERVDREIEFTEKELIRLREIQDKAVYELSALKDEVVKSLIGESIESVIVPNTITTLPDYTFYKCQGLTSITLPESITKIGGSAFYMCTGLKEIVLPESLESIGWYAFRYCSALSSINIPDFVTNIDRYIFGNCTNLTSVTIPKSVTNIDVSAFSNCTNIATINYEGTIEEWNIINKGSNWNSNIPAVEVTCSDGTVSLK